VSHTIRAMPSRIAIVTLRSQGFARYARLLNCAPSLMAQLVISSP
jgi:hypothetical protein